MLGSKGSDIRVVPGAEVSVENIFLSPMEQEFTFQIEILSGRGIQAASQVDYMQHIQLHCLFEGHIIRSERVEFIPDPIFHFLATFHLK